MKSKSAVPLLMLLVLGAIFGYSGCTAIGFGIGAAIDSSKPGYDTIPGWRAASIKRGKDITLTKNNGEELKGEYLGLDTVAVSQYAQWYNESREKCQKDVLLPGLGDSISFTFLKPAKECKLEFVGFDNQYICVRLMGIRGMVNGKIDMNNLERITDKNGNLIELQKLKTLCSEGKIPALSAVMVRTAVMVKTNVDTIRVPTATVSQIEIPSDKNAKWVGLGIGAVVDVAIVVAVCISMPNMNFGGNLKIGDGFPLWRSTHATRTGSRSFSR
jgi:hypothetical protein